ncbi:MAG: hypothetical protein ACXWC8_15490 [Limisphaerales bacterium]
MKTILGGLAILFSVFAAAGQALTEQESNRIADAIYLAEGGPKARVPYGILSVKVRDKDHARQICLNTIQNNYRRWLSNGRNNTFLDFLGDRYCPPSDSADNRNWKRNVRSVLNSSSEIALQP